MDRLVSTSSIASPELTIAIAVAGGLASQVIARHLGLPGIVLLLGVGVLLGPDVANVVQPATIGPALPILVGFSVAVILFEGGLSLNVRQLRREGRPIRQLATVGALVSAVAGIALGYYVMHWPLRVAMLFGTLAMVTGPTVINPLMRRLRVESSTATILEAEGVLVDAIGAIAATVALEVALEPTGERVAIGSLQIVLRLGFGVLAGVTSGFALGWLLRIRHLIPEGLENIVALALVLLLYQASNAIQPESGIAAVICAGAVLGNQQTPVSRQLVEFKEQLTVMFIGMLFVLLAADVRLADVVALGWPGVLTVAALIFVVRPLSVAAGTWGAGLSTRRRLFLSWIGPRGIVAAAVASFFASRLEAAGVPGGRPLRALVFLLIAVSVVLAGSTGGLVGRWLGVRRKSDDGWILVGANELALTLARLLQDAGESVVCIDNNPLACRAAEEAGIRVIHGDALKEMVMVRADLDSRRGVLAVVTNDQLNVLLVGRAKQQARHVRVAASLRPARANLTHDLLSPLGADLLFGLPVSVEVWAVRLRHRAASTERHRLTAGHQGTAVQLFREVPDRLFVPLVLYRGSAVDCLTSATTLRTDDEVQFLLDDTRGDEARQWLADAGWQLVPTPVTVKAAASSPRGALEV